MIQSKSAGHAKSYFVDALQQSDYYLNDQELQGRFLGRLGARIGVDGSASKDAFFALCENIDPVTLRPLTPRTKEERTVGYDINFHCPKSVSLVHVLSKDSHIMDAFQASVAETMKDIEADAMTRVRKNNTFEDRKTGELLWAEFIHQTARPVDGSAPDPHLHSHCFVFNATWDEHEQVIKAGQFRDINRDMPYYQARFHKTLSDKLIDLGYQIRLTKKSFEIEGVPRGVIDLFSKRTNEIGEFAKEKGITGAKALSELGARTRSKKQKGMGMDELKQGWRKQIREFTGYGPGEQEQSVRHAKKDLAPPKIKADDCIGYAKQHCFERASVMPDRRFLENAYRHSIGERTVSLDSITDKFKNDKNIIHVEEKGRAFCTTHVVLTEEKHMVQLARQGQGKFRPLYQDVPHFHKLNDQQNAAISHVLTTSHQVSIIRGAAGAGKTTMMPFATKLMEKAGKRITVVAPSSGASRVVLAAEGFKEATTVAQLLVDKDMQADLKNQILWVDEAGLLGTKDMVAILELGKQQNARIILGGDTRQHSSVSRGDALRILNTVAGIKTAEISKIHRQKNFQYRDAVKDLSNGQVKSAFVKLDDMGSIKSIDPLKPNDELVSDYIKAVKNKKSALIVSPTNQQGENVTDKVRVKLRSTGLIGKRELTAKRLSPLNLTEAQKSDWRNLEKNMVVQFSQNVPGIKRGSVWEIEESSEKGISLVNADGKATSLPLEKANAFELYKPSEIGLSKGDKIRITKNGFDENDRRLNNGDAFEVVRVDKSGKINLINKASKSTYTLGKDFGHIAHNYCTTSHSSQGKTVDEVFISQPAATFPATDAKQFYVSVSRGRDKATIYTDDKEALLEYAERIGDRQSALELVGSRNLHLDMVQQMERDSYTNHKSNNISKEYSRNDNLTDKGYEPEL
ncbi:conjugative relaxase [Mucilaginibacter psychrotolerans]|uniref:Conjugative relaxase n=2 Tax=Mucilaginibacter psychrotolerans TaxID=1524096 RepID=A0A4Y8SCB0_9SPHI|nr:conjugative relaxase [Mucilaginibacter psychrotolerans]